MPELFHQSDDSDDAERVLQAKRDHAVASAKTEEEARLVVLVHAIVAETVGTHVQRIERALDNRLPSAQEREYLAMAIKREARKEKLREAIIDRSVTGLVWLALTGVLAGLWVAFKAQLGVGEK